MEFLEVNEQPYTMHNKNEVEIGELEQEVRGTFENIEKLTEIMHNFEG